MTLLDDGEVLRTPPDKRGSSMPRESQSRRRGEAAKRPALWNAHGCVDVPAAAGPEVYGQLPAGFLAFAYRVLCLRGSNEVLHVCSGGLGADTRGVRVDIRPGVRPDVVADGRALPFADESFDAVLIDPPYSKEYAEDLYGTGYPRPSALLVEACRVLRPSRRVGIVHFLVPRPEPGLRFVEVHGITTGCGYRIRALTVFEKEQRGLFERMGGGLLILVPLTRDEANAFLREHHRHCGRVVAHRGAIGCEVDGRLVGVAILANPPSRVLAARDRFLVEVVRLCVAPDAPRNACSWLYGRARRAATALGFRRVTTTTLAAESGASLRGAGFAEVARMAARSGNRKGWSCPTRPRGSLPTDGRAKVRWEASA